MKQQLLDNQPQVDKRDAYKVLDPVLPPVPEPLQVVQQQERTTVVIGEQLPKLPVDKNQKTKQPAKKSGNNKDSLDYTKINWATPPQDTPPTSLHF